MGELTAVCRIIERASGAGVAASTAAAGDKQPALRTRRHAGRAGILQTAVGRGWALVGASWRVLLADKVMAVYPILSGVCTVFALTMFVLPAALLIRTTRGAIDVHAATSNPGRWRCCSCSIW